MMTELLNKLEQQIDAVIAENKGLKAKLSTARQEVAEIKDNYMQMAHEEFVDYLDDLLLKLRELESIK